VTVILLSALFALLRTPGRQQHAKHVAPLRVPVAVVALALFYTVLDARRGLHGAGGPQRA
jgi:hypothetical protein